MRALAALFGRFGAVLAVTQWMLVFFTDAYFPLIVKAPPLQTPLTLPTLQRSPTLQT